MGVFEFFDEIIVSEDLGVNGEKPNILPFQTMKERLGIEYEEMMYIGDNPAADFYIGSVTKIITVRINYGGVYNSNPYWMGAKETHYVDSISSVQEIVKV